MQVVKSEAAPAPAAAAPTATPDERRAEDQEKNLVRELTPVEAQRLAALDKMEKIEHEFTSLKDTYFARKVRPEMDRNSLFSPLFFTSAKTLQAATIQSEMALIEGGKHEQFIAKDLALQEKQRLAIEAAARERTYQIRNAQLVYEAEVSQAEKDLALDRKHLKKKMLDSLQMRLEELEEEKRNVSVVDFNAKKAAEESLAGQPKKKKPKPELAPVITMADGRRKRLNPPHVNYSIRDTEIYNDLHLLKRSAGGLPRAQLEAVLYDVYASGNDGLVYYNTDFIVGHPLIVADREARLVYTGVLERVSPVEILVKPNSGSPVQSIELAKLRDGELSLLKP